MRAETNCGTALCGIMDDGGVLVEGCDYLVKLNCLSCIVVCSWQ
jgi:hypothetical protein